MLEEFKKFILKGSVIDLAVGIVIGGTFTQIVNSLVNNIIMPIMSVLTYGIKFKELTIDLSFFAKIYGDKDVEILMPIGLFINQVIEFLIIGFSLFIFVKFINKTREKIEKKKEEEAKKKLKKIKK